MPRTGLARIKGCVLPLGFMFERNVNISLLACGLRPQSRLWLSLSLSWKHLTTYMLSIYRRQDCIYPSTPQNRRTFRSKTFCRSEAIIADPWNSQMSDKKLGGFKGPDSLLDCTPQAHVFELRPAENLVLSMEVSFLGQVRLLVKDANIYSEI
jgi:hypothetical protein